MSTKYHIGLDMSPKVKMCNEFKESRMGYWEKIGNRKSELKDINEQS